jgi:hypothetical protein
MRLLLTVASIPAGVLASTEDNLIKVRQRIAELEAEEKRILQERESLGGTTTENHGDVNEFIPPGSDVARLIPKQDVSDKRQSSIAEQRVDHTLVTGDGVDSGLERGNERPDLASPEEDDDSEHKSGKKVASDLEAATHAKESHIEGDELAGEETQEEEHENGDDRDPEKDEQQGSNTSQENEYEMGDREDSQPEHKEIDGAIRNHDVAPSIGHHVSGLEELGGSSTRGGSGDEDEGKHVNQKVQSSAGADSMAPIRKESGESADSILARVRERLSDLLNELSL